MGKSPVFSSLLGLYCSKLRGRAGGCPYFDSQDTNNGVAVAVCTVVLRVLLKKNAPVNRKSPGRILDMGAMARGRA